MEHVVLLWFAFILVGLHTHVTATCDGVDDCFREAPSDLRTKAGIIQFCAALPQVDDCLKAPLSTCSDTNVTKAYASRLGVYRYLCSAAEQHSDYWVCIDRENFIVQSRCPFNFTGDDNCLFIDENYVNCLCDGFVSTCGQAAATFQNKIYLLVYEPHCSSLVGQTTACGGATTARPEASLAQATLGGLVVPSLLLMLLRWQ